MAALPQLDDEVFSKSVILVVRHNEGGALGFLLNRPYVNGVMPAQLVAEIRNADGQKLLEFEEPLFFGGGVEEDRLFVLYKGLGLKGEQDSVGDQLWFSSDPELFQDLLGQPGDSVPRSFFLGCTSWSEGQLDSEIRTGTWMILPFDAKFLFQKSGEDAEEWSEEYWKTLLRHGGCDPLTLIGQGSSDFGPN